MKIRDRIRVACAGIGVLLVAVVAISYFARAHAETRVAHTDHQAAAATGAKSETHNVRKVLVLGDSMTGWLAERLNAYGTENGFEVATIVWDGSTIQKWGNSKRTAQLINEINPDAVIVSLGMNELFERNPEGRLKTQVGNILKAIGNRQYLWIGPLSWPGHNEGATLDNWLATELGEGNYFSSFHLNIPRQSKTNPHPTREGMITWMDAVTSWVPEHANMKFESLNHPQHAKMSRGKTFIYRRMKEAL